MKPWLQSLAAAAIVGGSTALTTTGVLAVAGQALNYQQILGIFASAALHGALAYLAKSPLPAVPPPNSQTPGVPATVPDSGTH